MSDHESILGDIQLDVNSLIERINNCDPTLCKEDWREITYGYNLDIIEFVYQHIEVEEMLDFVTEIISKEFLRLYHEGKIEFDSPLVLDRVSGYHDLDLFKNRLIFFADRRRTLLEARREEQETRERYSKKLNGRNQETQNSFILSGWSKIGKGGLGLADVDSDDKDVFYNKELIITEELVSHIDWEKKTQDFNVDVIKDIVKNLGLTYNEKKIVIKAIYDALCNCGHLSLIPYDVDKTLNELHKIYDENGKGLWPSDDSDVLNPRIQLLFKKKWDEYWEEKHALTEKEIDEIIDHDDNEKKESKIELETFDGDNLPTTEKKIKHAIMMMKEEKIIKNLYDYAFIMKIVNETDGMPNFISPRSFIIYLKGLSIVDIPSEDSIKKKINSTNGKHPSWTFNDKKGKDANEALRRNNLANRFLSIYRKGK